MSKEFLPIKTIPFTGGVDLAHEASALPLGGLSQDQNFRPRKPGKESRLGQARHHTTMDQNPSVESFFETLEFDASAISIEGISYASDGTLWVCDTNANKIYNIETDGTWISEFATTVFDGSATDVTGISYASNGTLWVCDAGTDKIYNIETDGTWISEFATSAFDASATGPSGVSCAPNGTLWVCDIIENKIYNVQTDGTWISEFATSAFDASATDPSGVSYATDDTLWVCDRATDKIYNIESDGTLLSSFSTLVADSSATDPGGVSYAPDGTLWYTDKNTDEIYNLLQASIISLYGFSKSKITERHFFAQNNDGSVDEATDNPPTVTTGDFGTSVLAARANSWPASWAKFEDFLVYADGAAQAQIYTGQNMKPILFSIYKGTETIPLIPEEGADYTTEVIDDLASTYADASSLADLSSYHCMFAMFDTPINKMSFELSAYNSGSPFEWTESGSNPVIGLGSGGTWNDVHVQHPTVIKDGSTYKMWMNGYDGSANQIGYYTSSDGVSWTPHGSNPVLSGTNNRHPTVIKDDSTYKMWVCDVTDIDYYTSSDGITWTPYGSNPVITGGVVQQPTVIKDGSTYKMWQSGSGNINYFTSSDGISWALHGSSPLLSGGLEGPTVIKDGSTYEMWASYNNTEINHYTSSDGISWTPDGSNPVIGLGSGGTWNDAELLGPAFLLDGTTYKIWVAGGDGANRTIGLYTRGENTPALKYWNGSALTPVSNLADGTADTIYLEQDGSLTWDNPINEVPTYAFGRSGFLYQWSHDDSVNPLDSSVNITKVTGEYTGGFQTIQNVWDGIMPEAIEAIVQDTSAGTFYNYSSQAILAGDLVGGGSDDYIYISSPDLLFGIYLDVGGTPNETASTLIDEVATWTGAAFTNVSGRNDATDGGASSGYVTWQRLANVQKVNFNSSRYHAYWYRIKFSQNLSSDLSWAILTLPYFDINKIYPVAQAVHSWDNRLWYSFNDNMLYGTDWRKPTTLNGDNYLMIEAAKHSKNKAICMRRFYQFLLVWGEEKGEEGGYFSIIQPGADATGYDSQIISERIGIMNNKSAVVLEAVSMGDLNTERPIMKGVYFLSRSGVYKSDGSFLKDISGNISNYFDPSRSDCIRRGYEKEHFLAWDSVYGVLRLGLVSGGSAVLPNKFFIYDVLDGTWHEDVLGQSLSCVVEIDGASGDIPVLQYGGGQVGYVYRLNTGDSDITIAIDKSIKIELDGEGHILRLKGMAIVVKAQAAGNLIVDVYRKGEAAAAYTKTLPMQNANADYKGHRFNCDVTGDHLTIRLRNNTVDQPVYLLEYGLDVDTIENNIAYD